MNCKIFISYRRDDSKDAVRWLYDKLQGKLGPNILFMDKESIETSELWEDKIIKKLEESEIVLIVIGPQWLTIGNDEFGRRRIDKEDDWVRKEIETALKKKKIIYPILIQGAKMPPSDALPDSIKKLPNREYFELNENGGATSGIEVLISLLAKALNNINQPDELRELLAKVIADKYTIIKEIGRGVMSKVYLAKDKALDRYVAIKAIQDPKHNSDFKKTLQDAAKMVKYIPNSIQILGAWVEKDPIHVVMSYLEGGTLREYCDETDGRGLPLKEAHNQLLQIGEALVKAHDAGMTHCNIMPSNILLGSNKEPYLSPLCRLQKVNIKSILKNFSPENIDASNSVYRERLCYLAPDIFNNDYLGKSVRDKFEKIDQYMLGLLGYELLSGRIPHTVSTINELEKEGITAFKSLERISKVRKECPEKLSDIIHKMISRDPGERYQSLKEAIDDLNQVSFDAIEIAKDSYARCIAQSNTDNEFFKVFYAELIRISPKRQNGLRTNALARKNVTNNMIC